MKIRYFRPKSLTWWSGIAAIIIGICAMVYKDSYQIGELARLIGLLTGGNDTSPAGLMFLGSGLIGLGDKFDRAIEAAQA